MTTTTPIETEQGPEPAGTDPLPSMKLEVVVVPVVDTDRAKRFYEQLGWRLDADIVADDGFRVVQFTPPASPASIIFGTGVTDAEPGSLTGLHLVVADIDAARTALVERGVGVSDVFHDVGGIFHHAGHQARVSGPAAQRRSYGSFVSFDDPDGNEWIIQEVTARAPGRVVHTTFGSEAELSAALGRAAAAHGEHEELLGTSDPNWPAWYAAFIVREQARHQLPT